MHSRIKGTTIKETDLNIFFVRIKTEIEQGARYVLRRTAELKWKDQDDPFLVHLLAHIINHFTAIQIWYGVPLQYSTVRLLS